jgi:hypothetical protein
MLMFRARAFRLRDTYPDVLHGLPFVEEAGDRAAMGAVDDDILSQGPGDQGDSTAAAGQGDSVEPSSPPAAGDGPQFVPDPEFQLEQGTI